MSPKGGYIRLKFCIFIGQSTNFTTGRSQLHGVVTIGTIRRIS